MRKVMEKVLVASGNQSLFAASTDVFVKDGGSVTLNGVLPGQLVYYDYTTGKSLAVSSTIANADRVVWAVGKDTTGNGMADVLVKVSGEKLFGGAISSVTAEPSRCGVPQIKDLYYSCVDCGDDFAINVTIEDDSTQNAFPYKRPAKYAYSAHAACCACNTCDNNFDNDALTALFLTAISEDTTTPITQQSIFQKRKPHPKPFEVVKLFGDNTASNGAVDGTDSYSKTYCLSPIAGACGGCNDIDGIKAFNYDGGADIALTNAAKPGAPTLTLIAQLENIVKQINDELGADGKAVITSALNGNGAPCCDLQLHINSAHVDFTLVDDEDADIAPCSTANPFFPADGLSPVAGMRFIAKPVDIYSDAGYPADTPRGYLGREMEIYPVKGFKCGTYAVKDIQDQVLPENTGYEWKFREYQAEVTGTGKDYNVWGRDPHGMFGLPLRGMNRNGGSRARQTTVDPNGSYCSYVIEHSLPSSDPSVHGKMTYARMRTVILIPTSDTVTIGEFETAFNNYLISTTNNVKVGVTCASDTDQDADEVANPNVSGHII